MVCVLSLCCVFVVTIPYSLPTYIAYNFKTSRTMFRIGLGVWDGRFVFCVCFKC